VPAAQEVAPQAPARRHDDAQQAPPRHWFELHSAAALHAAPAPRPPPLELPPDWVLLPPLALPLLELEREVLAPLEPAAEVLPLALAREVVLRPALPLAVLRLAVDSALLPLDDEGGEGEEEDAVDDDPGPPSVPGVELPQPQNATANAHAARLDPRGRTRIARMAPHMAPDDTLDRASRIGPLQ